MGPSTSVCLELLKACGLVNRINCSFQHVISYYVHCTFGLLE